MFKRLMKESVIYGVANVMQKLVPFFVVPIIIHQMGQTALKLYDVAFVYAYLVSWLLILGQDIAASVFYFDKTKTNFDKKQVLGYGLGIQTIFFLFVACLFIPFRSIICGTLFSADPIIGDYWLKALVVMPGHMLMNYVLNILLWQKRIRQYVTLCIFQTVLSLGSVYIAIVLLPGGLDALFNCLIGSTTACGLIGLILIRKQLSVAPFPFNKVLFKKMIWFGLPFAVTIFIQQALLSIDRYFLLQYGYTADLPYYIVAVKLGGLMSLGVSAFVLAFTPYSMAKLNDENAEKQLSSLFHFVAVVGFMVIPVILFFKDILLQIIAGSSYTISGKLLPFFFFGWMFDLFSYFSMLGIYKGQNSLLILAFFGTAILLISGLNMILIPKIGLYGAAVAFCVSKAALFFMSLIYLRKHFKLTLHPKSFTAAGGVAIACSFLLYQVEWYVYFLILTAAVCGTVYYLYKRRFAHIFLQ